MLEAAVLLAAYLLGSLPSAYLLVRRAGGGDVREVGSGNVGATNAMRASGWKVAVAVLVLDVGKGLASVLLMRLLTADPGWAAAAGLAGVIGHCFPVWLRFDGGKGVATGGGAWLLIAPLPVVLSVAVWLGAVAATRWVAAASLLAVASLPVLVYFLSSRSPAVLSFTVAASLVVIWRHRANLARIVRGEEPRVGRGRDA